MKTDLKPFSRLLLPVDTREAYNRSLPFAGLLMKTMEVTSEQVDILHVITGSFLGTYMKHIDISSGETPTAEEMKAWRKSHYEDVVVPLLAEASSQLQRQVNTGPPGLLVKDGDPVRKIGEACREGAYTTLVMSRRNQTEKTGKLTGSVVAGVLHRYVDTTIYLIGDKPLPDNISPFTRCLIGIDGSPASKSAVLEAGTLLARVNEDIEKVLLVHVLDQSCYYDESGVSCIQASELGQQALEEAGNMLIDAGVDAAKVSTIIHFGRPGTVLAKEAVDFDATLIFIGRRDRSRMAQVFLGSVCTDMVQNCMERTIVLSS